MTTFKKIICLSIPLCLLLIFSAKSQTLIKSNFKINAHVLLGGTTYLAADDGVHGNELWKTDGTSAGTVMIKDIYPGSNGSMGNQLITFNGKIYFSANDGARGAELWQSDGTAGGTVLFKDFNTNGKNGSNPFDFFVFKGELYFLAGLPEGFYSFLKYNLWKTDGTAAGTVQVTQSDAGDVTAGITETAVIGDYIYFDQDGNIGKTDGTAPGGIIASGVSANHLTAAGNKVFYVNTLHGGFYSIDVADNTPVFLLQYSGFLDQVCVVGNKLFISSHTGSEYEIYRNKLYVTDGTLDGSKLLGNFDAPYSVNGGLIAYNNKFYFTAANGGFWTSDGTIAGTVAVPGIFGDGSPVVIGGLLYYSSDQINKFDGTTQTRDVPLTGTNLFDGNGKVLFSSNNSFWSDVPGSSMTVYIGDVSFRGLQRPGGTATFRVKADSTSVGQVTVTNTGAKALVFSDISVSGNSFYVNGHPSQTVPAGGQATFNLLFSPIKEGNFTGTLNIKTTDNAGNNNFNLFLNGTTNGVATGKDTAAARGLLKSIVFTDTNPEFTLTNNSIIETSPANSSVGTFKLKGGTYAYQLVTGAGSDDNSSFNIAGNILKTAVPLNFATKSVYTIRVKAAGTPNPAEKNFVINVTQKAPDGNGADCAQSLQNFSLTLSDAVYAGARIVAISLEGFVLLSDDNGATWKKINPGVNITPYRVRFGDANTGYLAGTNPGNAMLKTVDGGNNWFPIQFPTGGTADMTFLSANLGFVYGAQFIYKTIDGGKTWINIPFPYHHSNNNNVSLYSGWFFDEKNWFVTGTAHSLFHTTDGGATWATVNIGTVRAPLIFTDIAFVSRTIGYATGDRGEIFKTTDGGSSWIQVGVTGSGTANARIYFANESTGYFLGHTTSVPLLYKTTNGAKNWTKEDVTSTSFGRIAVNSTHDKFCLVGGPNFIALKSGNGNWVQRSSLPVPDLTVPGLNVYAGGDIFASGSGYLEFGRQSVKTLDGGVTWQNMQMPFYADNATAGHFITDKNGYYIIGNDIYLTTDGGTAWKKSNTDSSSPIRSAYFFNPLEGFYFTDANYFRTTDGGTTWDKLAPAPPGTPPVSIAFADAQHGFAVFGNSSLIYTTSDIATTWTPKLIGLPGERLSALCFVDAQNGYAGGSDGILYRTADGGATWQVDLNPAHDQISAITFRDSNNGFMLSGNYVFQTVDAGATWLQKLQLPGPFPFFAVHDGPLLTLGNQSTPAIYGSSMMTPLGASYISGDTTVLVSAKTTLSITSAPNTGYKWVASGPADIQFLGNSATISWSAAGKYTVQVTPFNSCGDGASRTITVNVEADDLPDPVITGPITVPDHAINALYTSTAHPDATYQWSATNSVAIKPNANKAAINWGAGPGTGVITLMQANTALGTKKFATLNVTIQKGTTDIPENTFSVKITSATCKGSNNGLIVIKAIKSRSYLVTVTGPGSFSNNYAFTDSLKIDNLAAGAYNACITIKDNADFQRCYVAEITEPKDLSLFSTINTNNKTLTINLSGADTYYIELNGNKYQTANTQLQLPLVEGANKLKVYSDKLCQGVIEKYINLNKITLFPDPFEDNVNINLGNATDAIVGVEVMNALGKTLYKKQLANNSGQVSFDATGFGKGVYLLKLTLGDSSTIFKIAKK